MSTTTTTHDDTHRPIYRNGRVTCPDCTRGQRTTCQSCGERLEYGECYGCGTTQH